MKKLMILGLLTLCILIGLPVLAQSTPGTATVIQPPATSYRSFSSVGQDSLVTREKGNGKRGDEWHGPTDPIANISLMVSSLGELDNVDSYNRSLIFFYDPATKILHVATRLFGPESAMKSGTNWSLGGYAHQGFQMDVTQVIQNGKPELNGRASLPLVPGDYILNHYVNDGSKDSDWTYPLFSCPAYGGIVGCNTCWGYYIRVLASGEVITRPIHNPN